MRVSGVEISEKEQEFLRNDTKQKGMRQTLSRISSRKCRTGHSLKKLKEERKALRMYASGGYISRELGAGTSSCPGYHQRKK